MERIDLAVPNAWQTGRYMARRRGAGAEVPVCLLCALPFDMHRTEVSFSTHTGAVP